MAIKDQDYQIVYGVTPKSESIYKILGQNDEKIKCQWF